MTDILKTLNLSAKNASASTGSTWWSNTTDNEIVSYNPTDGKAIGAVYDCSRKDYETVITEAQKAFQEWRMLPAPKRGEIVRQIGEELRKHKDALGSLVSLEMGKSKQEGNGEVQEMI